MFLNMSKNYKNISVISTGSWVPNEVDQFKNLKGTYQVQINELVLNASIGIHEHERKKLEKKIENEEDAHVKALESKMEAKAAKEMSDAHARAEELAKIHKAELANSNISEALQNKLLSQMDKDRDAMAHMLEEQRHRQAAAMKARLAERRIKRKKDC